MGRSVTGEDTDPCNDPMADLGDIFQRCSVTIPVRFEDGRGVMGLSHNPFDTETLMSTRVLCCVFAEREDGKYDSVTRMALSYEGAQQIRAFIKKLPEQVFSP